MNFISFHERKLYSLKNFSHLAIFFIVLVSFCSTASAKTEDHCWRTADVSQFKSSDPEIFLASMLEEFKDMRRIFPETTEEDRDKYILEDSSNTLKIKYTIDVFIESILTTLNYQKDAEDGDILGYLYLINELQESLWDDLIVSFMMADSRGIGAVPDDSLSSYIKNVGSPFISSLNKHILLCIIPKEVNGETMLEGQ